MPRKIRPKYGIDPVQEVPVFSFTDTDTERLLNALPSARVNRDVIIVRLVELARAYRWRRGQNQTKPTRAEQNAALTELDHFARNLEMRLRTLDMDTEWELTMSLPVFHKSNPTDTIGDLADRLADLVRVAGLALQRGKRKSGPRARTYVQRAVVDLVKLYEEATGTPSTHNPKERTKYVGTPHSLAGGFIVEFFRIVDSAIPVTSLSTALASTVKSRSAPTDPKAATG
jgi:hypothetical protein